MSSEKKNKDLLDTKESIPNKISDFLIKSS